MSDAQAILDTLEGMANQDFENSPAFKFARYLREELAAQSVTGRTYKECSELAMRIPITIKATAGFSDSELVTMAVLFAKTISKMDAILIDNNFGRDAIFINAPRMEFRYN